MTRTSAEIAIELRGKFEFYLLALTFSILGLSIQTAEFGAYLMADLFELAGWLALFASGLVGILRAQWIPVAYDIQAKITSLRRQANDVRRGGNVRVPFSEAGKEFVLDGDQAVVKLDGILQTLESQYSAHERRIIRRYAWIRRTFVLGVACLMVARGTPPAISLGERLARVLGQTFGN